MKMKQNKANIESGLLCASGLLYLFLFLPIAFCVFFIGIKMNYSYNCKINVEKSIFPNWILLIMALIAISLLYFLYLIFEKIQYTSLTCFFTIAILFLTYALFYVIAYKICRSIVFFSGWDVSVVAGAVYNIYDGISIGENSYFQIYSNNVPITYVLFKIYEFARNHFDTTLVADIYWVKLQCFLFALSGLFVSFTVLLISKKISITFIATILSCLDNM